MDVIRSGLGNDVDNAAGSAPKFRVCTACDDLEFLDRVECDVDRSALPAELLAKEAVVVVTPIEADVIEHAALPVKVDLVSIRALCDGHTRRQCQQVFKLAPKHWSCTGREFVQG